MAQWESWDEYLFKQHGAVRLDHWSKNRFHLLDVLIKKGRENGKEKLVRAGSILNTGHWSDGAQNTGWNALSRNELKKRTEQWKDGDDGDIERSTDEPEIRVNLERSKNVLASIFGGKSVRGEAGVGAGAQHKLAVTVGNVSYERVKDDFLMEVFRGDAPLWKPDVAYFMQLGWSTSRRWPFEKSRDVWTVTKIMYATKIIVSSSESLGAGVNLSFTPPGLEGVGGELEIQQTADGKLEITAPTTGQGFPFALKAFKLRYSTDGHGDELLRKGGIDPNLGHRPISMLRYSADIDEDDYHMADLLEMQEGDGEDRVSLLAISILDDEGPSA